MSHSLRKALAVLTWKFIDSIAITLKYTLHIILLILLVSVTLHKNNQGKYYYKQYYEFWKYGVPLDRSVFRGG